MASSSSAEGIRPSIATSAPGTVVTGLVTWTVLLLAAAGLLLVGIVDVAAGHLAFNDDFMYSWDVQNLVAHHALRLFPDQQPSALVQIAWSAIVTAGHPDPRWLRLSLLPFVAALSGVTWLLARRLDADPFWSGVAAAVPLTCPFLVYLDSSFNSDIVYAALVMASLLFAIRWQQGRGGMVPCIGLSIAATAQRQSGFLVALAVGVVIAVSAFRRAERPRLGRDLAGVAALCVGSGLATVAVPLAGLTTATMRVSLGGSLLPTPAAGIGALLRFPSMLGLEALPFLVALLRGGSPIPRGAGWVAFIIGAFGVANAALVVMGWSQVLGIDLGGPWGVGPESASGAKIRLLGAAAFGTLDLLVLASLLVVLLWHHRTWSVRWTDPGAILIAACLAQVGVMVLRGFIDRYAVIAALPLLPLLARQAGRSPGQALARGAAMAVLAAGLLACAIGEQDLVAWQSARDTLARGLYASVAGDRVHAGFEANALLYEIPYLDARGDVPPKWVDPLSPWALHGPQHPDFVVCFAAPGDPRRGVDYRSAASGRMVVSAAPCAGR